MPAACHNAPKLAGRRAQGFTLLEVLAVMAIVGIIVTMAVLSMGDPAPERVEREAERLSALTELAQEEALFGAEDLALSFWQGGYAFHRLEGADWMLVTDDRLLRARELPPDLTFSLRLEGREVVLSPGREQRPQVFLLSSGEITPFELYVYDGRDTEYLVTADSLGNLEVERTY